MNNTINAINKQNSLGSGLPNFKAPSFLYPFLVAILIFIVFLFMILYKVNIPLKSPSKSQEELAGNIFGVLFFVLLLFVLSVTFIPNFKQLRDFFSQISSVTFIVVYIIFITLFFSLVSKKTIDSYAYIIVPALLLVGGFAFYKGASTDYISQFNVSYERIKALIIFFCLIVGAIIFYNTDPGGYIKDSFGYTMLLTVIISIFMFLYLIILFTLPNDINGRLGSMEEPSFLDNFSKFGVYNSIGFLLFIIFVTIAISNYKGGFFNDKSVSGAVMVLLLIICVLWSIVIGTNLFPEVFDKTAASGKMNLIKRIMLALFGVIISSLIIYWIVYNFQHLSGKSGIPSLILNIILVIIILGLIYKTINVRLPKGNSKKNAFFSIIINTLFYIPCLFTGLFDWVGQLVSGNYDSTTAGSLIMIVSCVIVTLLYYEVPALYNFVNLQGGKQLVNDPVYTDTQYSLGTYETLNGSEQYDYQYAISCWVYIDSAPPSTSASYNKYTSLLNFGDKPNILYNAEKHTLMIVTQQQDLEKTTNNKLIDFDESGNRIIYVNSNFLLQKWNNIIINYNGGMLDIFLNGELVKSDAGVVPYYKLDNLTIGETNGIKGGICNVVYFKKPLTSTNIYYLYNMVKNGSPPITKEKPSLDINSITK